MDAANLLPNEKVAIVDNFNNGERFETYVIKGRGSGVICLNGGAARKCQVGDVIIIMAYALMDFEEAKTFKPAVVFPDTATKQDRLIESIYKNIGAASIDAALFMFIPNSKNVLFDVLWKIFQPWLKLFS